MVAADWAASSSDPTAIRRTHVAVCVPLRDERRNIAGLIAALGRNRSADIKVVLAFAFDGCSDDSGSMAAEQALQYDLEFVSLPMERSAVPDAGRARWAALTLGADTIDGDGVLLTTDADTRPYPDWIATSLEALRRADLVCGHIQRQGMADDRWRRDIEDYLDRLHAVCRAIDPVEGDATPCHWHEGGASLGMTVAAWRLIGAQPLAATGEDREIVRRARLAGLVVRQDPTVRVRTSSRLAGRAKGGLADALRNGAIEAAAGVAPLMEHPDDVVARAHRTALAREAFGGGRFDALSRTIGLSLETITTAAEAARSADAFVAALPLATGVHRSVAMPEAASLLAHHEDAALVRAA